MNGHCFEVPHVHTERCYHNTLQYNAESTKTSGRVKESRGFNRATDDKVVYGAGFRSSASKYMNGTFSFDFHNDKANVFRAFFFSSLNMKPDSLATLLLGFIYLVIFSSPFTFFCSEKPL